jgi:putative chitinase
MRADLGNTPQVDGNGRLRAGKGPLQLTSGFNEREFIAWLWEKIDRTRWISTPIPS